MTRYRWIVVAVVAVAALTAAMELGMGRLLLGPDGNFGWWEGDVWSREQSQRFADPYSFSRVIHGMMFYVLLWLVARNTPVRTGSWRPWCWRPPGKSWRTRPLSLTATER